MGLGNVPETWSLCQDALPDRHVELMRSLWWSGAFHRHPSSSAALPFGLAWRGTLLLMIFVLRPDSRAGFARPYINLGHSLS